MTDGPVCLPPESPLAFLSVLSVLVNHAVPYIFGGKDPSNPTPPNREAGLDCSGCVTWALEQLGIVPEGFGLMHSAASLWEGADGLLVPVVDGVREGDLAFYGRPRVDHVMAVFDSTQVVGASGAGATCVTVAEARRLGACVHYRAPHAYRSDLVGYRRLAQWA